MQNSPIVFTEQNQAAKAQLQRKEAEDHKAQDPSNALLFAFYQILEAVHIQHGTAQLQANSIEANAQSQAKVNSEMAKINYQQLNADGTVWQKETIYVACDGGPGSETTTWNKVPVTEEQLQKMNMANQEIGLKINYLQNKDVLLRQTAQVNTTDLNTAVNTTQQAVQIDGSLMQMLTSLTNQIANI